MFTTEMSNPLRLSPYTLKFCHHEIYLFNFLHFLRHYKGHLVFQLVHMYLINPHHRPNSYTSKHRVRIRKQHQQHAIHWIVKLPNPPPRRVSLRRVWNRYSTCVRRASNLKSMARERCLICQELFHCKDISINRVGYRLSQLFASSSK